MAPNILDPDRSNLSVLNKNSSCLNTLRTLQLFQVDYQLLFPWWYLHPQCAVTNGTSLLCWERNWVPISSVPGRGREAHQAMPHPSLHSPSLTRPSSDDSQPKHTHEWALDNWTNLSAHQTQPETPSSNAGVLGAPSPVVPCSSMLSPSTSYKQPLHRAVHQAQKSLPDRSTP